MKPIRISIVYNMNFLTKNQWWSIGWSVFVDHNITTGMHWKIENKQNEVILNEQMNLQADELLRLLFTIGEHDLSTSEKSDEPLIPGFL